MNGDRMDPADMIEEIKRLHEDWVAATGEELVTWEEMVQNVQDILSKGGPSALENWTNIPGDYKQAIATLLNSY
jgi:hypothetical protein